MSLKTKIFDIASLFLVAGCVDQAKRTDAAYPIEKPDRIIVARYGDGLPIKIFLPSKTTGKYPVLFFNHGRPFRNDVGEGTYNVNINDPLVFRMNSAGIAVAFPIRTGYFSAPGFDGERIACNDPTGGQFRSALSSGRDDIVAAIEMIRKIPELDADNVFIGGQSAGGFLTLASLDAYPANVRAAVSFNGGRCGKRGPFFNGIKFASELISGASAR